MATSLTQNFSKEEFKKNVISNCKSLYRKNIEEANDQEVFQAVSYAVKDIIIDKWIATHKQYEKDDPKMVYYMSMEFLMGRALGNNMINLYVSGNDKIADIVNKNAAQVKTVVLAQDIITGKTAGFEKEWDINGEKVTLAVEKLA